MRGMLLANHGVFRRGRTQGTALDIRAHVGTSTSPTAPGNRAVTGVGFQPKAVLPFGAMTTAANGVQGTSQFQVGTATPISQASISVRSSDAATTSSTFRSHTNARALELFDSLGTATVSAFEGDGFTLNYTAVSGLARTHNHICLGGADLEVSLTQHQMNATNAPQSFAHGLSGAPTGLMFFSAVTLTAPPGTTGTLNASIGCWSSLSQFSAQLISLTGQTTTSTARSLWNSSVLGWQVPAIQRRMAVSTVDATSVNCTYPTTVSTEQPLFWMLAIRGARCQVGTFDCNGSTSPLTINTPGITPRLFLPVFVPGGVDNVNTVQNGLELTIGASDGTRNVSSGITDQNGVTTTNARRYQNSSAIEERNNAGTSVFSATAAFSGQSVVLSPTVNTSSAFGQGGFLVVGS